jgi:hypothetical protein
MAGVVGPGNIPGAADAHNSEAVAKALRPRLVK